MGTAVGNRLYAQGGWVWSGSFNIAFIGVAIIVGVIRGPRETGWVGWSKGWSIRKDDPQKTEPVSSANDDVEGVLSSLDQSRGERHIEGRS